LGKHRSGGPVSFHDTIMAQLLKLPQHSCERGDLTVFEHVLPGVLKRIFYITNADGNTRGGHRHRKAWQALVCIQGSVEILVENRKKSCRYLLTKPTDCLVLEPDDWHLLENFQDTAIVLVVSNEYYDEQDYIYERYTPEQRKFMTGTALWSLLVGDVNIYLDTNQ
jgi:dTDP-4-dehydrorhamnose 3,5-epimerase-like enzyme